MATVTELEFVTLDVFTKEKYRGNPLAVVRIPDDANVTQEQKQRIANEFNLSETVFFHESDSHNNNWRVDIFTANEELPFAGHPTIGSACYALSRVAKKSKAGEDLIIGKFNIKAGTVDLQYNSSKEYARVAIPHDLHVHDRTFNHNKLAELKPELCKYPPKKQSYPIVSIVKGMTFVLVELESLEVLQSLKSTPVTLDVEGLDKGWDKTFSAPYFYVRCGSSEDGTINLRTRLLCDVGEDAATGSAASDLAGYLSLKEGKSGQTFRYSVVQGVEMGRRSDIGLEVVLGESEGIKSIFLGGHAVEVMRGSISL